MRASDADRERVVDILKAAYVYGLVSKDEFDERVSQTLASRTSAELSLVTADIPAGLAAAPATLSPAPALAHTAVHVTRRMGDRAAAATGLLAGLGLIVAFFVGNLAGGYIALGATVSALLSLAIVVAQMRSSRRNLRSGGQLPPRGAIDTGQGNGQLPRASQPRRRSPADTAARHSLRPGLST